MSPSGSAQSSWARAHGALLSAPHYQGLPNPHDQSPQKPLLFCWPPLSIRPPKVAEGTSLASQLSGRLRPSPLTMEDLLGALTAGDHEVAGRLPAAGAPVRPPLSRPGWGGPGRLQVAWARLAWKPRWPFCPSHPRAPCSSSAARRST